MLGGIAIGIGLYFTWKKILISQDGQITERFTRAVDQLGALDQNGNPAFEIRLGRIYALDRISKESEKDSYPIMEILTAYIRKNSAYIYCEEDIKEIKSDRCKKMDFKELLNSEKKVN
jgi:hypothetical protein